MDRRSRRRAVVCPRAGTPQRTGGLTTPALEAVLLADVRARFRTNGAGAPPPQGIGAELELLALDERTLRPVPVVSDSGPHTLGPIRRAAEREGWREMAAGADPPSWLLPGGSRISFEPGGQLEISSARFATASDLIAELRGIAELLRAELQRDGIVLEAFGVDPYNDVDAVELQLRRPRYERMTRYFETVGSTASSGVRMMRQTASIQVNVELGGAPQHRWTLLNSLAPYLTAIFANSPRHAGKHTGHQSYRAHLWRTLDSGRTGLPLDAGDPARSYLDFALAANAMLRPSRRGQYAPFRQWASEGVPAPTDWDEHLSTLFPEIRPRHYFEIRSVDAIAPRFIAAPVAFIAGIVYDETASCAAREIIGDVPTDLLVRAGEVALRDPGIRDSAARLANIALAGCRRLGESYISAAHLAEAAEFFAEYTLKGRVPADDSG